MSVIQSIRDKGAWIISGLIALALIAFILQDRFYGRGNLFSNTTTIGKVNGEKIERTTFEEEIAFQQKMYGQQSPPREQMIPGVWNQMVNKIIMQDQYDRLGLTCGQKELDDILFGENSPLKREFTDPQTGQFKVDEAKQAFAQIKKSKNEEQRKMIKQIYVDPAVENSLQNKYQALLQQSAYVPKWLVEKQQADNSSVASASYVYVPYSSIADSSIKVSDEEIGAYVKKHLKEYDKEEEERTFSYVTFDASASSVDSNAVRTELETMKAEFISTPDVKAFLAKAGSDMQFYDGDVTKSNIKQRYRDSIIKEGVGKVYGPYLDGGAYAIAKLLGTKRMADTAKVRHILIATIDGQSGQRIREDSTAKKLADSIQTAIRNGANFDSLVVKYSDDPGSKTKGGVYDNITTAQMVPSFNDFCFSGKVGDKGVVATEYGYHYIEILSLKGNEDAYKIAYISKAISPSNETVSAANAAAAKFAADAKSKKAFEENALKLNKPMQFSGEVKENDFSIPSLGQSRTLVRWLYEHGDGDVSDPTEIGEKYIVAIQTYSNKPGSPAIQLARPLVENFVRNEKKAKQIIAKLKGNTLEAIAASAAVTVQKTDSLSFGSLFVPAVGNEIKLVGAAFNKTYQGKISEPIAGSTGVFVVKVNNIGAVAGSSAEASIRQQLLQNQKMAANRGVSALRKAASVKDYRSKFF